MPVSRTPRTLLFLLASALVLGGCLEQTPLTPEAVESEAIAPPSPSMAVSAAPNSWLPLDRHVVLFSRGTPNRFQGRVEELGGTVLRVHPEIGVAVVAGLSHGDVDLLSRSGGIRGIAQDVAVVLGPNRRQGASLSEEPGAVTPTSSPADAPLFGFQWNLQMVRAHEAWQAGFLDASGVRVAILDSGIDPFHGEMVGKVDEASSVAFVESLNQTGPVWGDDDFHGTHVSGTVTTNGLLIAGVAPGATLIAIKVCGFLTGEVEDDVGCPVADVVAGLVHAGLVGADVANMSLGGFLNIPSPGSALLGAAIGRAVNFANREGTLVVAAAGNNGLDLDHLSRDFGVTAFRMVPCESGVALCVSATGPTDLLASYSNFGFSAVNMAAPGGDLVVTGSPLTAMILGPCSSLTLHPDLAGCMGNPGGLVFAQGTSMAAPHVAGAAALATAYQGAGPGRLRTGLERTAEDLGPRGRDPFYGRGRLDVCALLGC